MHKIVLDGRCTRLPLRHTCVDSPPPLNNTASVTASNCFSTDPGLSKRVGASKTVPVRVEETNVRLVKLNVEQGSAQQHTDVIAAPFEYNSG